MYRNLFNCELALLIIILCQSGVRGIQKHNKMKQEQKCVLVTLIMLSTGLTIPDTWFSMSGGDEGIPAVKTGTGTITFPPLQSATEKKYCNAESREEVCKICKKWGDSFEQKIPFEVFTQRSPHHEDITRAGWEDMLTDLVKAVYSKSNIPSTVNSYIIDVGVPDMQDYKWLEPLTKFIATKSTCEIHSFEANPQTAELIKKKMRGSDFYRQYVKLYNIGMGNSTMRGSRMFWKNAKEPGRGSFQRIRTDDYEQIPVSIRVIPLDDIYSATDGVFIPILKMGAGRWEFAALNAGIQTLKNTAIVVSDTTPVPLNKDVVSLLSSEGFVVYAITNGSLARIPQNAPWWWTSVVAVKPFLQDVAESHVCFDFTESPWVCESPVAAKSAPVGCRKHGVNEQLPAYSRDTDAVNPQNVASPEVHRRLKFIFLSLVFGSLAALLYSVLYPIALVLLGYQQPESERSRASHRSNSTTIVMDL